MWPKDNGSAASLRSADGQSLTQAGSDVGAGVQQLRESSRHLFWEDTVLEYLPTFYETLAEADESSDGKSQESMKQEKLMG